MSATERHVRLFRNGCNQAVRIPREFEIPGDEAILRQEEGRLVIESLQSRSGLLQILATLESLDEPFPDVDDGLKSAEDVEL